MAHDALVALLRALEAHGYGFVTPSPATHRRYLRRRRGRPAASLRDVFGWSLPFEAGLLPAPVREPAERAGILEQDGETGLHRVQVRVSRVAGRLLLHSAFPTDHEDSVFLGPDTYRFVHFLQNAIDPRATRLIDMGAGSGAGAIAAAALLPVATLSLIDSNPEALRLARANAEAAGVAVDTIEGTSLDAVPGEPDLVIANPPFIAGTSGRTYRDGGDMHGARLSLDWSVAAARRLAPDGRVLLYTGSAIVDGHDALRAALAERLPALGCALTYKEIDPDIFGEQLDAHGYESVERIAAIGAVIQRLPFTAR